MNDRVLRIAMILLLSAVCATGSAQPCHNDIAPTAPDSRFTDHGDGTVSDAATGLMWKQCAEGLIGAGCASGTAVTFINWQNALQQATDATFAGHTDWRLPNMKELESLVERRCFFPAINITYFPNTPMDWFWSSSPTADSDYLHGTWTVEFFNGNVSFAYQGIVSYVRLVRGGP